MKISDTLTEFGRETLVRFQWLSLVESQLLVRFHSLTEEIDTHQWDFISWLWKLTLTSEISLADCGDWHSSARFYWLTVVIDTHLWHFIGWFIAGFLFLLLLDYGHPVLVVLLQVLGQQTIDFARLLLTLLVTDLSSLIVRLCFILRVFARTFNLIIIRLT